MSTNKAQTKQNKHGDQQTNGDKHEQTVASTNESWWAWTGPAQTNSGTSTNKGWWVQMGTAQTNGQTSLNEGRWAWTGAVQMNGRTSAWTVGQAWTRAGEHERGLPKQTVGQVRTKALSGNITTTTAGTGAGAGWQQEQWECVMNHIVRGLSDRWSIEVFYQGVVTKSGQSWSWSWNPNEITIGRWFGFSFCAVPPESFLRLNLWGVK